MQPTGAPYFQGRHGWEYVPLVLFAVGAAIYKGGAFAEVVLLTTTAGVYMVSRKEVRTQAAMPADW